MRALWHGLGTDRIHRERANRQSFGGLERFHKCCSDALRPCGPGLFAFWRRFGSVTGFFKPAPSPKPRQKAKIRRPHRYIISVNALAFSLVELLVVIAIIAVLAALLLPALTRGKARAQRVECISDLKEVGLAFQMFAHDHQGRYPMQVPFAEGGSSELVQAGENIYGTFYFSYRHFQTLANELVATKPLICPADVDRAAATSFGVLQNSNVSYFVGVNADFNLPLSILAGDRNITNNGYATASLVHGAYGLRWTSELHVFKGNVLFSDAHVEEMNNDNLNFSGSPLASSTFFLPAVNTTLFAGSGSGYGGGGGPNPSSSGGGQAATSSGPVTQAAPGSGANASAPAIQPAAPLPNNIASRTANHGSVSDATIEASAREINATASANAPRRTAMRGPDDEPEPPLMWLTGTAKNAAASAGWWLVAILLLLLAGVYVYARKKIRERDEAEEDL